MLSLPIIAISQYFLLFYWWIKGALQIFLPFLAHSKVIPLKFLPFLAYSKVVSLKFLFFLARSKVVPLKFLFYLGYSKVAQQKFLGQSTPKLCILINLFSISTITVRTALEVVFVNVYYRHFDSNGVLVTLLFKDLLITIAYVFYLSEDQWYYMLCFSSIRSVLSVVMT